MSWIFHYWKLEMAAGLGYGIFLFWLVRFLRLAAGRRAEDDVRISRQLGSRERADDSMDARAMRSG